MLEKAQAMSIIWDPCEPHGPARSRVGRARGASARDGSQGGVADAAAAPTAARTAWAARPFAEG